MKSFQFSCCDRIDSPDNPDNPDTHGEIVVFDGLLTPVTFAENRGEALTKLHDWFIEHKCRPFQEVT